MAVVDSACHDRFMLHKTGAGISARGQQHGGGQDQCQSSLHVEPLNLSWTSQEDSGSTLANHYRPDGNNNRNLRHRLTVSTSIIGPIFALILGELVAQYPNGTYWILSKEAQD